MRPREVEPKTVAQSALNPANLSVSSIASKLPCSLVIVRAVEFDYKGKCEEKFIFSQASRFREGTGGEAA